MKLKYCKKIILLIFTFSILVAMSNYAYANDSATYTDLINGISPQKNILILHSYNQGSAWTSEQNSGIIETIEKANDNCAIFVEYMDWKNYPTNSNLQYLYNYYKFKFEDKKLDLVIATDDAAFTFALKNRKVLFSNAPIVFSGVNQEMISKIEGNYINFTGVIEEIDPTETIKMALKINPSVQNVYIVSDNSESGISTDKLVTDKIKALDMNLKTIHLNNLNFDKLLEVVSKLDNKSIIFFATYYSDAAGTIIDFNLASQEISKHTKIPLYHQYDFGLNKGALGGNMMSGRLSGNHAAGLAIRILNGETADNIQIVIPEITRKVFDYEQLKRFNIPYSKIPKDAEIINKPFSFYETYKALVLGVLIAFTIMVMFLITLLMYINKIRNIRKQLSNSNEELTQTYEELVATDEEMKNQLDEISTMQISLSISEEKYTYLALHDVLTGLPNRRSLFEVAKEILSTKFINKAALLFIDMDNFKYINDTMGHEFGDELIKKASERLLLDLNERSSLYRLGGDEFIMLAEGVDKSEAEKLITDILYSFNEEFIIRNSALHISFSIGLAMFPEHGEDIEELIKAADIAMYKAKEAGKNRYIVYEKSMNKAFNERMNLEKYLHLAMNKNEFELYYQPQLDLNSNRITGLEALLRWKSPELGFVSPLKFIKVAEDTHLIIPLGEWVLVQACDFLSQLNKSGHSNLTISVNISIIQIFQADFTDRIIKVLEYFQIDPSSLELEITETILIESFDVVYEKLKLLSEMGIGIALDDFGKGYSSLSYLKLLPISTLKIDKCFIDNVALIDENKTITRHIITLGRSLGMSVIAEGVELQEQLEYLKKYHCDKIQGYLFSKPVPKDEVIKLLDANLEK